MIHMQCFLFCLFIYFMGTFVHEKSFEQSRAMINHVISQAESHEISGTNL